MQARMHTLGGKQIVVRMSVQEARRIVTDLRGQHCYGPLRDFEYSLDEVLTEEGLS